MDREALEHLCALSRLQLSPDELVEFERKFARLLEFVDKTQEYKPQTEGPPLTLLPHVELRRDHSSPYEWPAGSGHDYRVPRIIDFEGGG